METLKAIAERKSIRSYQKKDVEAAQIETLIGAANSAPFAGPFHISVVLNNDLLTELNHKTLSAMKNSGNDFLMSRAALPGYEPIYGAPMVMIFSAPKDHPYAQANCSNAATCAALVATDLGLGSCYVVTPTMTLEHDDDLRRKAGIPDAYRAICCLLVGYTDDPDKYSTPRNHDENVNYAR